MKTIKFFGVIILTAAMAWGCASHRNPVLPVHDEVLVYEKPYDLTFLKTLDALQTVPHWDLEITDKTAGLIQVRNSNYSSFDDEDKRTVTFIVKRLDTRQSSVELAKESQQTIGSAELIEAVARELSK